MTDNQSLARIEPMPAVMDEPRSPQALMRRGQAGGLASAEKKRERIAERANDPYFNHLWLFSKVIGDLNGCWNFTGSKTDEGYGQVKFMGKSFLAHRAAFFIVYGWLPADKLICHHCDNPSCINPSHLFAGTDLDNTLDAMKKGRKFIPDNKLHRWKDKSL